MRNSENGEVLQEGFDEIYSVTEITEALRQNLESEFPSIRVSGEIANFKAHTSGHYYFTLRDSTNLLRAAMFRRHTYGLEIIPDNGMQVIARGMVSHYGGNGQTQLIVDSMADAGRGRAEQEMRVLLERLMKEGLTDPSRKRRIPAYPSTIAVITSPTGAVIRDIRMTVARRWPVAEIVHIPCDVQGASAAPSIVQAFLELEKMEGIDVVIAGRGGGSIEDLWAFNLEPVARAVAGCRYPVITGIGHEIDTTVCDHVADMRAATPTAAAELATPSIEEVGSRLAAMMESIGSAWKRSARDRLGVVEYLMRSSAFPALRHKMEASEFMLLERLVRLGSWWKEVSSSIGGEIDEYGKRAERSITGKLSDASVRTGKSLSALGRRDPGVLIASYAGIVEKSGVMLKSNISNRLRLAEAKTAGMTRSLAGLHPEAVLKRGYSYCRNEETGEFVAGVDGLSKGDRMRVTFHDGNASCLVEDIREEN